MNGSNLSNRDDSTLALEIADVDPGVLALEPCQLAAHETDQRQLRLRLSAVPAGQVEWIWQGLIPRGKLALLVGEPGVGKSLVALQIAAMVTRGRSTPVLCRMNPDADDPGGGQDANVAREEMTPALESSSDQCGETIPLEGAHQQVPEDCHQGEPGAVILLTSSTDGIADTIRPRLVAAGADLDRVYVVPFGPHVEGDSRLDQEGGAAESKNAIESAGATLFNRELEKLETHLLALQKEGVDVPLIVFDSADRVFNSLTKKRELPVAIDRLARLASQSRATVLVVANSRLSRAGGAGSPSGAFGHEQLVQAARSVFMILPDLQRKQMRLMLPVKMNLSEIREGISFTIDDGAVKWLAKRIPVTVSEYFVQSLQTLRNPLYIEETSEFRRAVDWLRNTLSEGPLSSIWVQHEAKLNGIAYITLRRAYAHLGCRPVRKRGTNRWFWSLPETRLITEYSIPCDLDRVAQHEIDEQQ